MLISHRLTASVLLATRIATGCVNVRMSSSSSSITSLCSCVELNNGLKLPVLGLGVYQTKGEDAKRAVLAALKLGYRHIDTAQGYYNESEVGEAVKASGMHRDQIWVTTKILPNEWADASSAYERTKSAVQRSLQQLGLESIDLMLLHAPGQSEGRAEAWRALEDAHKQGLLRSIGVSNFGIPHLEKLSQTSNIPPAVNQIELHPWLQRRELVEHCKKLGIVLEAYSPLARPYRQAEHGVTAKLDDSRLKAIAEQVNKTPAQVLLRWSLQKGFVPLPKSVKAERQAENAAVFDWQLSESQMTELDGLEEGFVSGWDPISQDPV